MPWGPNTPEQSRQFFDRRLAPHPDPRWEFELAIVLKSEKRVVGGVGLAALIPGIVLWATSGTHFELSPGPASPPKNPNETSI